MRPDLLKLLHDIRQTMLTSSAQFAELDPIASAQLAANAKLIDIAIAALKRYAALLKAVQVAMLSDAVEIEELEG
jgi:hypothetical protein